MKASPVTVAALAADLAARAAAAAGPHPARVAVDGAPTAGTADLAAAVTDAVAGLGTPVLHIPAGGFLRAASLRLERGRTNPDAYYEDWLDLRALTREVLGPAGPGGTGRVLPSLWDPATDRATRAAYVTLPAHAVVVVSGTFLLGAGLDFDVAVHLMQSDAALTRRLPPDLAWTLPAYARYRDEVMPEYQADVVVRADDPRHPALVTSL
ncbi:uridine kinase [Dactylosporangium sp. CA-139066]|uniref:uridine kinase n=1 Tax=Dactylosporangium sp. CA-139066 TaxID=3239930 RepID=UPI003D8D1C6B